MKKFNSIRIIKTVNLFAVQRLKPYIKLAFVLSCVRQVALKPA